MNKPLAHPVIEIAPTVGWHGIGFRNLWNHRALLYILVWRDLKVRYRQTVVGIGWIIGQPLISMLIYTAVFNRIARIESGEIPYPAFVLAGVMIWNFFANGVSGAAGSIVGNAHLITKVYFPRLLVPAANVGTSLIDFCVALLLFAAILAWYRIELSPTIIFLPFLVLLAVCLTLGIGIFLAAVNVEYRDVRIAIPFVLQTMMFATPVVYPLKMVPEPWATVILLNPMTGIVEGFRWCVFGGAAPLLAILSTSIVTASIVIIGMLYFRRVERSFADII